MPSPIKKAFFEDLVFRVEENVYEPSEDSFLFAENLTPTEGAKVLDMGTGCGILGITAAVEAREVVAIDISPCAVRCAKENARLNCVAKKIFFIQGDLFGPIRVEEAFDLILFNAPYLPSEEAEEGSWLGRAWSGGASGRRIIDNFIREAPRHLKLGGEILLMQSTLSDVEETLQGFKKTGLRAEVLARQDLPLFETLILVKAEFK
jgi:release factor glutamine methyltransferase